MHLPPGAAKLGAVVTADGAAANDAVFTREERMVLLALRKRAP